MPPTNDILRGEDLRINVYWQRIRAETAVRGWSTYADTKANLDLLAGYLNRAKGDSLEASLEQYKRVQRAQELISGVVTGQRLRKVKDHRATETVLLKQLEYQQKGQILLQSVHNWLEFEQPLPPVHNHHNFGSPELTDDNAPPLINWDDIDAELKAFRYKYPDLFDNTNEYVGKRLIRLKSTNKHKVLPEKHWNFRLFYSHIGYVNLTELDEWEASTIVTEEMREMMRIERDAKRRADAAG